MYCRKCGKKLDDGVKFCPDCGTPQSSAAGNKPAAKSEPKQGKTAPKQNPLLIPGIAALLVVVIAVAFFMTRKPTVSLNEFVTVSYDGVDGYGNLNYRLDRKAAAQYIAEKKKLKPGKQQELEEALSAAKITVSKSSELQNGEKISISCSLPEAVTKGYGFKLNGKEYQAEVSGLKEVQDVDITDLLTVTFSGATPRVEVVKQLDEEHPLFNYLDWDSYYALPYEINAKNGENYTLSLKFDEEKALLDGYRITSASAEYELEGLGTYDYTLENTDAENLQTLIADGAAAAEAFVQNRESDILRELGFDSGMVLWSKSKNTLDRIVKFYNEEFYPVNRTVLIYAWSLPVMKPDETIEARTIYVSYYCDNLIENADGMLENADGWIDSYYVSAESVEEELNTLSESIWSYGSEEEVACVRTEAVNEGAAEALVQEFSQPEPEETAELTEAAAPEVPEAAAQAAAETQWNGHRYYLFDTEMSWTDAKRCCEQMGGTLAAVSGQTEQYVLQALCGNGELGNYWIGATDQAFEGNWCWVTGEPFAYTAWEYGEPSNSGGTEHYACMDYYDDWNWNDAENERSGIGFIMELAADAEADEGICVNDASGILLDMESARIDASNEDTYGNRYYGALKLGGRGWAQYNLDGSYARLTGKIAVGSVTDSEAAQDLAVFGDGKLLYRQCALNRQSAAIPFDIDVSGIRRLTLAAGNPSGYGEAELLLAGLKLYRSEEQTAEMTERLADLTLVEGKAGGSEHALWRDRDGRLHEGYVYFDAEEAQTKVWNLNGDYTEFSGCIAGGGAQSAGAGIQIRIYGDDELLFEAKDWNWMQEGVDFTVDVTGRKLLRVETEETSDCYEADVYLTDDCLLRAEAEKEAEVLRTEAGAAPVLRLGNGALGAQVSYDGHHYYLIETAMTWESAKRYCEQLGGHLAAVNSPLEQRRLEQLLKNSGSYHYWIGASDKAQEGVWSWVTGEPFEYTCWESGKPDNYGDGENYLCIYDDGEWDDRDAEEEYGFILEFSDDQNTARTYHELRDLENDGRFLESSAEYRSLIYDADRKEHLSSYRLRAYDGAAVTVDLNGEYTAFSGTISSEEGNYAGERANIAIYGDGRQLFAKTGIYGWNKEIPFAVDVTGVKTLTIKSARPADKEGASLLINDSRLELAEEAAECAPAARLADLQQIDGSNVEARNVLMTDSYGSLHDGYLKLETYDPGYGVYLLGGAYTEFDGVFAAGEESGSGVVRVEIYGDDKLLFEQEDIRKRTEPIPFTLDVSGVNNLKIAAYDASEESVGGGVYLVDDLLK